MNVLVIAPHPDDEVLGCGGTIHRLHEEGHAVNVAICTKGWAPLFEESQVNAVRDHARKANKYIGTDGLLFMDLPVTKLALMPRHELNGLFAELMNQARPDWLFLAHRGDRHEDHRQIFDACMVAARPTPGRHRITRIVAYETVSETHWTVPGVEPAFTPNFYVDISAHLQAKLEAFVQYENQLHPFPHPRSGEALEALARFRGSTVGFEAAEAFMLVRDLM
jgi:N-acetylglucosamine malate deacetylase 1